MLRPVVMLNNSFFANRRSEFPKDLPQDDFLPDNGEQSNAIGEQVK